MKQNESAQVLHLQVTDGLTVAVIQDKSHEFVMPTKDVALGYGVAEETIQSHKKNHSDELAEGTHFVRGSEILTPPSKNGQPNQIYWTKAGIIRLGMFIKSERAKMFRDWIEGIILQVTAPKMVLPKSKPRNHNRLTDKRIIEILGDIAKIDDKELRLSLVSKLIPNNEMPPVQMQLSFSEKGGQNG